MNHRSQLHEELMYGRPNRQEAAAMIAAYRADVLREAIEAVEDPQARQRHATCGLGLGWESARDVLIAMADTAEVAQPCPRCKGDCADPDDEGDWDPVVQRHNPSTRQPCPGCNGTGKNSRHAETVIPPHDAGKDSLPAESTQLWEDESLPPQLREALRIMGRHGKVVELTAPAAGKGTPVTDEHLPPVDVCRIHTPQPSILPDTCTCSHPTDADCHPGETR